MKIEIKNLEAKHWEAVVEIYRHGLRTCNATFETQVPDSDTWDKRFYPHLRWVAVLDDEVVGWAGLSPVSVRKVYQGVAEVSIYIHPKYNGKGIGTGLMQRLVEESEKSGIWTLFASIFPENEASCRLHLKVGFRLIGYREKVAKLNDKWRDTLIYERRSKAVGL